MGHDPSEFCHRVADNQLQFKLAGNIPVPLWGIEASFTFQNNPGIDYAATRTYSRAEIGTFGANRTLNDSTRTGVSIMLPFADHGDRINQLDLRFSKRITMGRARVRGQFDVYNVTNSAAILGVLNDYGTNGSAYQSINNVLGARLFKFGFVFEY